MADKPPCQLWRDTRNNRIYRVGRERTAKVNMGTAAGDDAVEVEQYFLDVEAISVGQSGWGNIASANSAALHDWLDSIPTVV